MEQKEWSGMNTKIINNLDKLQRMVLDPPSGKEAWAIKLIEEKEYKGFTYIITYSYNHPCAYVFVNDLLTIIVTDKLKYQPHGGFTYHDVLLPVVTYKGGFIGWDYAHFGDYQKLGKYVIEGRLWSIKEIREECKAVIDSLIEYMDELNGTKE